MVDFDAFLTRADVGALEGLIGASAVRLLSRLDPQLVRPEQLRGILVRMRSPADLLYGQPSWNEIVDLLSATEARELAQELAIDVGEDAWASLKRTRASARKRKQSQLFAFFGLLPPDEADNSKPPSQIRLRSEHSLFSHQRRAAREILSLLGCGGRRAVLHMPTGSGKTRTAMHIAAYHLLLNEPATVIWLAYSEELCEQAFTEFQEAWRHLGNRELSVIRYWGQHDSDPSECTDGFIVAGLSKTYQRALAHLSFIGGLADLVSLVIIDEAHQAVAPSYRLILDTLASKQEATAMLGLTATPGRSWDEIDKDRQLADFFANRKVSLSVEGYANPIEYLIDREYLSRPEFKTLYATPGIHLSGADFAEIEKALDVPERILRALGEDEQRTLRIVTEVERLAVSHSRILVFAPSVESAYVLATALDAHGKVRSMALSGSTPAMERSGIIAWYKAQAAETRVLCNFGVLTAGFDAPATSAVLIARPTKSLVLYSQMVGRGTRGVLAGGTATAEIVTVVDTTLPGFRDMVEAFNNWEDAGWR